MVLASKHVNHQTVFSETMDCWKNTREVGNEAQFILTFRIL